MAKSSIRRLRRATASAAPMLPADRSGPVRSGLDGLFYEEMRPLSRVHVARAGGPARGPGAP